MKFVQKGSPDWGSSTVTVHPTFTNEMALQNEHPVVPPTVSSHSLVVDSFKSPVLSFEPRETAQQSLQSLFHTPNSFSFSTSSLTPRLNAEAVSGDLAFVRQIPHLSTRDTSLAPSMVPKRQVHDHISEGETQVGPEPKRARLDSAGEAG